MLLCCWWYLLWVLDENENYIFLIITLHASYGCRLTWRVSVQGRSCSQPSGSVGVDDHRQIPLNYCCSRRNDPGVNQNYYMSTPVPKVSSFAPVSVVHVTVVMVIVRLPQLVQCGSTCCVITGNVGGWVGIKTTLPDLAYASLLSCELINISWQIQLHPCWAVLLLVKMNVLSWLLSNQRPWM